MNRFSVLLRAMMAKELRTLLRERGQLIGLLVAVVFGIGWPFVVVSRVLPEAMKDELRSPPGAQVQGAPSPETTEEIRVDVDEPAADLREETQPVGVAEAPDAVAMLVGDGEQIEPTVVKVLRWSAIGAGCFGGFFVASALGAAMALGSFAAEKDENTLEVLLATPLTDTKLYLLKYLAVTLPCIVATYVIIGAFALVIAWWAGGRLSEGWNEQLHLAILFALPAPLLVIAILTGLQVCVSSRADSLKGAGQLFGITFMVGVFALIVLPMLIRLALPEGVRDAIGDVVIGWFGRPFVVQYVIVMGLGAIVSLAIFVVGLRLMNRERMLT